MLFGRMRVLGVVAGLVVSLVVFVSPGAAEAVDPGDLDVTDFVVLGVDGVYLKQNASVVSGDVGAINATSGPYLAGSQETTIGLGVTVPVTSRVLGDSVKLKQGSTVGDVYTNNLSGDGTVTGSVFTPVSFPLDVTLPEICPTARCHRLRCGPGWQFDVGCRVVWVVEGPQGRDGDTDGRCL